MNSEIAFSSFAADLRQFMAYAPDDANKTFQELALRLFALQYDANEPLRRLCQALQIHPGKINSLDQLPSLPAAGFKHLEISCLPKEGRTRLFTSSGTTGQIRSRHYHNGESLALYEDSLWTWFEPHFVTHTPEGRPQRLICLSPDPQNAPHSSLVHMFETVRRRLKLPGHTFFGECDAAGDWQLDLPGIAQTLSDASYRGHRVLMLGTAFSFVHLTDYLKGKVAQLRLPSGSRVMETGGYKGRARTLTRSQLRTAIVDGLGVAEDAIISEYGMSELSSQAYDMGVSRGARKGMFQFPHWARARIVSSETGREVADGEVGLIQILDLSNAYSAMCVQTEDLGIRFGNGFELIGRAQMAEPKGCSLMMQEEGSR